MLPILQAAIAALTTIDAEMTARWKASRDALQAARDEESVARSAMQDTAGVLARLDEFLTTYDISSYQQTDPVAALAEQLLATGPSGTAQDQTHPAAGHQVEHQEGAGPEGGAP